MLLRLAFRNVLRARARSALTIAALLFCVMMSLLLSALVMGVGESLVAEAVEGSVGSIQVHREGYFEKRDRQPLKFNLEQNADIEAKLRAMPHVKAVTPRLTFSGLLTNGSQGTVAVITAVDPATVRDVLPRADMYLVGDKLANDDKNGVQVGIELASALGAKHGSPLMISAQGLGGRDNALDLELRGTLNGQNPLITKRNATVPLAFAQSLLGMQGKVTEYVIAVDDPSNMDSVADALRTQLGAGYEVQTWEQLRPGLRDARLLQRAILGLVSIIFLIIALFGVANTLLMSVLERTREIGTMLAVGMTRSQVARMFVLEALVQAVLGSIIGLSVALVVVSVARSHGGFTVPMGNLGGIFTVMPTLLPQVPYIVVGATCIGSMLAAVSPALRAARLRPVEALSTS